MARYRAEYGRLIALFMFQDHPNLQVQCNIAKRSCLFARHLLRAIAFTSRSCFSILNTSVQICQACNESVNICKSAVLCNFMQVSCCMSCHSGCLAKHTSGRDELHRVLNHQPGETTPQESMQIRCCFLIFLLDSLKLKKNSNDPGITKVIYAIYSTPQCFPPACSHLFLFSQAVTRALKPLQGDKD